MNPRTVEEEKSLKQKDLDSFISNCKLKSWSRIPSSYMSFYCSPRDKTYQNNYSNDKSFILKNSRKSMGEIYVHHNSKAESELVDNNKTKTIKSQQKSSSPLANIVRIKSTNIFDCSNSNKDDTNKYTWGKYKNKYDCATSSKNMSMSIHSKKEQNDKFLFKSSCFNYNIDNNKLNIIGKKPTQNFFSFRNHYDNLNSINNAPTKKILNNNNNFLAIK